jgi:hypothetical protein
MRRLVPVLCLLGLLAATTAGSWTVEAVGTGAAAVGGGEAEGADEPAAESPG